MTSDEYKIRWIDVSHKSQKRNPDRIEFSLCFSLRELFAFPKHLTNKARYYEGVKMRINRSPLALLAVTLLLVGLTMAGCFYPSSASKPQPNPKTTLNKFNSCESLVKAFKTGTRMGYSGQAGDVPLARSLTAAKGTEEVSDSTPNHSKTNVQVEGVDEADIVKNDGKYIYLVANNSVMICRAHPPSESQIVWKNTYEPDCTVNQLYIGDDRLVVIGNRYSEQGYCNLTFAEIWSTVDKSNPRAMREVEIEGVYSTSRKTGDFVYLILNNWPDHHASEDRQDIECEDVIPKYRDTDGSGPTVKLQPISQCTEIGCLDPDSFTMFITILSLPIANGEEAIRKQVIAGSSGNVYASQENFYLANTEYRYEPRPLWDYSTTADDRTTIYKFSLHKESIAYVGNASVPGTVLNQLSMDEHKKYVRIATTRGHVFAENANATNNLYVLDENLQLAGKIENIAPGEKIYSARFMGDKGYLVTFKKVDPFFTLDLTDPENPKIIGQLKIPGYSDYLHPYDENHIIGIGKSTVEAGEGDFAWYQGLKMAVFDVSDFQNPKEMHNIEIGDRGTDSYALHDHKAILFDREKNLLVIPILLAERPNDQKRVISPGSEYGAYRYQGAYVYNLSLKKGFELKGRITHKEHFNSKPEYFYGEDETAVKRSLYIGDFLYTVSGAKLMIHELDDLDKVRHIDLRD